LPFDHPRPFGPDGKSGECNGARLRRERLAVDKISLHALAA
jgi:hypothetical protein